MSNNTSGRVSPSQFAFFLGFFSLLCFGLVAARVLPLETGWSARVTNGVLDTAFAGVILLLGTLGLAVVAAIRGEVERSFKTLTLFGRPASKEAVPAALKVLKALDVVTYVIAVTFALVTFVFSVAGGQDLVLSIYGEHAPIKAIATVLGVFAVSAFALNYAVNARLADARRAFYESLLRAKA